MIFFPDANGVPRHCRAGIIGHVLDGRGVGGFLAAVLRNDLAEASLRADDRNCPTLAHYGALLRQYLPSACWGSDEQVDAWRDERVRLGRFHGADWPPAWEAEVAAYVAEYPEHRRN